MFILLIVLICSLGFGCKETQLDINEDLVKAEIYYKSELVKVINDNGELNKIRELVLNIKKVSNEEFKNFYLLILYDNAGISYRLGIMRDRYRFNKKCYVVNGDIFELLKIK